jgi:AAHS family benzoate transporter-like MFS transporter
VAGVGGSTAFYIFGGVAIFGALVTLAVPRQSRLERASETAGTADDAVLASAMSHSSGR